MSSIGTLNTGNISGSISGSTIKGLSAYEVAVKNGFVGTESQWVEFLKERNSFKMENNIIYYKSVHDSGWTQLLDLSDMIEDIDALESGKVDKVTGKSLMLDSEISRLASVTNYNDSELRGLTTSLRTDLNALTNGDVKNVKDSIVSILSSISEINTKFALYRTKAEQIEVDELITTEVNKKLNISDLPQNVSAFNNDAGYLSTHQDISNKADVGDSYTKEESDNKYITEHQDITGKADKNEIITHNSSSASHSDIRQLISGLTTRFNTLVDTDDTTLDQLSEIVTYIKSNKSLIDGITSGKVNVSDIVNNLTSDDTNKPLSAKQGKALKGLIDAIVIPTKMSDLIQDVETGKIDEIKVNGVVQTINDKSVDINVYTVEQIDYDEDTKDAKLNIYASSNNPILDKTLKIENRAADSKSVGDQLDVVKSDLSELKNDGDSKESAGKVWTTTSTGAEWKTPTGGSGGSYDDSELRGRIETIEGKESDWDSKSDFSGSYNDLSDKPTIPTTTTINSLIDAKITPLETLADDILEVIG